MFLSPAELSIKGKELGDEGVDALATALLVSELRRFFGTRCLTQCCVLLMFLPPAELSIKSNKLGDEGVDALATALLVFFVCILP
jgi:hypothetical protein